jgi:hypothetical protein
VPWFESLVTVLIDILPAPGRRRLFGAEEQTVKKHMSHVPGKLDAANRTEAVARARELSLIP